MERRRASLPRSPKAGVREPLVALLLWNDLRSVSARGPHFPFGATGPRVPLRLTAGRGEKPRGGCCRRRGWLVRGSWMRPVSCLPWRTVLSGPQALGEGYPGIAMAARLAAAVALLVLERLESAVRELEHLIEDCHPVLVAELFAA